MDDDLNIIVMMKFGSHLYGTATPDSDLDYKGIFLPTRDEILLNRVPQSFNECTKKGNEARNTSDDVDTEIYSLHYFLKLACEGQTVALDMLHAPKNMLLQSSWIWESLVYYRTLFYTKNLQAFVGYARRQAAKYGIKGSRLNAVQDVIAFLSKISMSGDGHQGYRLCDVWNHLPRGEHIHDDQLDPKGLRIY